MPTSVPPTRYTDLDMSDPLCIMGVIPKGGIIKNNQTTTRTTIGGQESKQTFDSVGYRHAGKSLPGQAYASIENADRLRFGQSVRHAAEVEIRRHGAKPDHGVRRFDERAHIGVTAKPLVNPDTAWMLLEEIRLAAV